MLFHQYHEDMRVLKQQHIDFITLYNKQEELDKFYTQATKLIFSKEEFSFGELMTVENFVKEQESGGFISYDGTGYYIDFDGNKLGQVHWHNFYNYPEGTVFVAWYNK